MNNLAGLRHAALACYDNRCPPPIFRDAPRRGLGTFFLKPSGVLMSMTQIITDAALLDQFVARRDEAAFAELVRRHGPMVRATCRRVLGERPDVDDAFQAVFVVLANKAAAVRKQALLGPWLHTVAVRTAHKARSALVRRAEREQQVVAMVRSSEKRGGNKADWLTWLDEELQALPAAFREPLVLCELEELSRAEAAAQLRIPEGTLSSRLARGKDLLRERLRRRGAIVSVLALGLVLSEPAQGGIGASLIHNTVQAAIGGAVSAPVTALAQGVLQAMFLKKLMYGAAVAVVVVLGVAGLGVGWYVAAAHGHFGQAQAKSDQEKMQGKWDVVAAQMFGKDAEGDEGENIRKGKVVIEGDKLTMRHGGKFTLNPDKKPKELDMDLQEGPAVEQGIWRGIYELRGDELTLVIAMPNAERPREFKTEANVPHLLLKLKRAK
jgi:RNA polymerase sigma factor (sigma-70 family)